LIHIDHGCGRHFGLSENRKSEIKGAVVGFRFPHPDPMPMKRSYPEGLES
jgi:hypothetical protein